MSKTSRTLVSAFSLLVLASGCLPRGGGGGGAGGGSTTGPNMQSEGSAFDAAAGEEPGSTVLTLTPPGSLTIDGEEIVSGQFVVEAATAYAFADGGSESRTLVADEPVVVDATIGQGTHDLFETPETTGAVSFEGYFDATEPDLDPAVYDVTVFGDFSEPIEMTVFLPANSDESTNQISGATSDGEENVNVFTDEEVPPESYPAVVEAAEAPGELATDQFPLNVAPSATGVNPHGNIRARPPVEGSGPECMVDSDCVGQNIVCSDQRCVGDGALRFTLTWSAQSDFDLHVLTPDGTEISFQNPSGDNFTLDRDDTSGGAGSVENVFFTVKQPGTYTYWVVNYSGSTAGDFQVVVFEDQQQIDSLSGNLPATSGTESEQGTVTIQ